MSSPIYPVDYTGQAATNRVQNELHTLTQVNAAPQRILIPTFAPFYLHNFQLEHVDQLGVATPLHEGSDYYFALPYMAASRSTGQSVYGGIAMLSNLVQGTIRIASYQTVGGQWCANADYVYEQLLLDVYNKRTTWWDSITNVQQLFPPTEHAHPSHDVEGSEALLQKMDQLIQAVSASPNVSNLMMQLVAHVENLNNPHQATKAQVGLPLVENIATATDGEALAVADVNKHITLRQLRMILTQLELI